MSIAVTSDSAHTNAPDATTAAPPETVPPESARPDLGRILGLRVPVSVTLAEREMNIESLLAITVGTIIEFDVPFDAELPLKVADRPIAQGQAVKVGENFGLQISRVHTVHQRIDALGGR